MNRVRLMSRLRAALLLCAALVGLRAPPDPATQPAGRVKVDPPVTVRVAQVADRPGQGVIGDLVEYSSEGLTLEVAGQRRAFLWIEITPHSAFTVRYRLIDQAVAQDWLELGEFAWEIGAEDEAEKALRWALRIDPTLEAEAQRIRAEAPGRLRGPFQPREHEDDAAQDDEPRELLSDAPVQLARYQPVTPEQAADAVARADAAAEKSLKKLGVNARRLESNHFVIYTDWDAVDDEFLTGALEDAYALVAGEFGIPIYENIFVGKLPVYMFEEHATFMRYARELDGHREFQSTVAGYYTGRSDGMGKLVMSRPRQTEQIGLELARQIWRRNLTHEFSHAFFARYRSNAFVPRWLNEGLAEVIAEKVYPRHGALSTARRIARANASIASIFDDKVLAGPEMYPVMMTLVQALYEEDPKRFMEYIDRIKTGENPQKALRDLYEVDYRGLEAAWRRRMMRK